MMFRARHPHDDRLFDCYLTARHGEPVDPRVAEHLADCSACAERYAEMGSLMDAVAMDAEAESDAVFTPERLRAQQEQILHRIEHVGRSARVISFPRHLPDRPQPAATHTPSRWLAAAAAAGLFIGVGLGAGLEWQRHTRAATTVASAERVATPVTPVEDAPVETAAQTSPAETAVPDLAADDAFLSDLDVALERTQTRELRAIDALTPHVRGVREIRYLR